MLNFFVPIIVQILFILYYVILKGIRKIQVKIMKPKSSIFAIKSTRLKKKINSLEFEGFILVFFAFLIEMTAYCTINLTSLFREATTKLFQTSTYMAALYFLAMLCFLIIFYSVTARSTKRLASRRFMRKWGILYRKFRLSRTFGRKLRLVFFVTCFLYAFILIAAIKKSVLQSSLTLVNIIAYLLVILFVRSYIKKKHWYMEVVQMSNLIVLHLIIWVICLDDNSNFISSGMRNVLGWFYVIFYFFAYLTRLVILAIQIVLNLWNWIRCIHPEDTASPEVSEAESEPLKVEKEPIESNPLKYSEESQIRPKPATSIFMNPNNSKPSAKHFANEEDDNLPEESNRRLELQPQPSEPSPRAGDFNEPEDNPLSSQNNLWRSQSITGGKGPKKPDFGTSAFNHLNDMEKSRVNKQSKFEEMLKRQGGGF